IIVSPAGVNPFEQVAWFLRQQALGWGLSAQEADAADRLHRAVALYYAGRSSHSEAQAEVDRHRSARWFQRVTSHPYWDEMPSGRVLTPDSLARALRLRPLDFEVYRAVSSFADYRQDYAVLRGLPTLIVYGGADELVPVVQSKPLFEDALRADRRFPHGFRTFDGASHDIATPDGRLLPEYLTAISEWARA